MYVLNSVHGRWLGLDTEGVGGLLCLSLSFFSLSLSLSLSRYTTLWARQTTLSLSLSLSLSLPPPLSLSLGKPQQCFFIHSLDVSDESNGTNKEAFNTLLQPVGIDALTAVDLQAYSESSPVAPSRQRRRRPLSHGFYTHRRYNGERGGVRVVAVAVAMGGGGGGGWWGVA